MLQVAFPCETGRSGMSCRAGFTGVQEIERSILLEKEHI
jgi:hypothetical protein